MSLTPPPGQFSHALGAALALDIRRQGLLAELRRALHAGIPVDMLKAEAISTQQAMTDLIELEAADIADDAVRDAEIVAIMENAA